MTTHNTFWSENAQTDKNNPFKTAVYHFCLLLGKKNWNVSQVDLEIVW